MSTIIWRDDFSVKIGEIDKQHKAFINMFNSFIEAYQDGEAKDILYDTLKDMLDYLNFHFAEEEKYMTKYDYPGYEAHHEQHIEFIEKTNQFVDDYFEGNENVADELIDFLSEWFVGHVMGTDMKYVSFFKEKGVS